MKEHFMRMAIAQAKEALKIDEVPIGAVIVKGDEVIAAAYNSKEQDKCALKHAELIAIERASRAIGDWRLNGCDIYVTLEPCPMCAGAIINARMDNLFFGAYDYKAGCCGTLYNIPQDERFNHRVQVEGGILQEECGGLLSDFFKTKRGRKKEL